MCQDEKYFCLVGQPQEQGPSEPIQDARQQQLIPPLQVPCRLCWRTALHSLYTFVLVLFAFVCFKKENQLLPHWCPTSTTSQNHSWCALAPSLLIALLVPEGITPTCSEAHITQSKYYHADRSCPSGTLPVLNTALLHFNNMSYLLKMQNILNYPVCIYRTS